ncbi:hypothetical protein [Terrarubrum flagellatum]|uniref:hypothetical protein n=1 Tax=Terrirubrum flagellatum TaxID=2895980 RepID=UPI0031455B6A
MLKRFLTIWVAHGALLWAYANAALNSPSMAATSLALALVTAGVFMLVFAGTRRALQFEDVGAFAAACALIAVFSAVFFQRQAEIAALVRGVQPAIMQQAPTIAGWRELMTLLALLFVGAAAGLWFGGEQKKVMRRRA